MMIYKESIKWLENLKKDMGKSQFNELWHYEQALTETIELLQSNKLIELPYPLGTKVFVIRSQSSDKNNLYIFEDYITGYIYGKYGLLMTFDYHLSEDNFERVFTDKLKAEEELKELNNEKF